MPPGSGIQAALQMGDTTLVAWGSYAYSSNGILYRQILVQVSVSGRQIGSPLVISDSGTQPRDYVGVAKLADRFVVLWSDLGARDPGLYARFVSTTGLAVGPAILLEPNAQPNASDVIVFDGDSTLSIVLRPWTNQPVALVLLTNSGRVRRTAMTGMRLDRIRPAGGLDAMIVCGDDTCLVLSKDGEIQPWGLSARSAVSPLYIGSDSSLAVLRDSALLEYDNVTDVQPVRARPVRGLPTNGVVQLEKDAGGRMVILFTSIWNSSGRLTVSCVSSVIAERDTVVYTPTDTLYKRVDNTVGVFIFDERLYLRRLRGNGFQIIADWIAQTPDRYPRVYSYTARFALFPPLVVHSDSVVAYPQQPGHWYPGTVSVFPERAEARDSSAVTLGTNRFASRLAWSGGLGFKQPNVYDLRGSPAASWLTNNERELTLSGFRTGSGAPWTVPFQSGTKQWIEKGSAVLTPVGTVFMVVSDLEPFRRWICIGDGSYSSPLGVRSFSSVDSELVEFEPDASTICVLASDGPTFEIRHRADSTTISSYVGSPRHMRPSLPLVGNRWLIVSEGRPTHVTRYPENDVVLACSVAARPGASIVRLRQSGVLRWYRYEDSTGTGTEFERIHVDMARLSAFVTGRGRLPGIAPAVGFKIVEDARSDTVRALFVMGERLMVARFEPIDFHVIDTTRIAHGAVTPTHPSAAIIGDSLYVVWVDHRDVDGTIWGVSIALDENRKRTLSERQVRTPLGQDTTEWVPPGPFPDPPPHPPTYASHELRIWPTPAHEQIRVTTGTAGAGSVRFDLLDLRGRLLKSVLVITDDQGAAHVMLSTDDLPNGTYLIRVLRGERVAFGRALVVHPK